MEIRCEYSRMTIPSDRSYATVAARYVSEVGKRIGFEEEDVRAIELGVEHAVAGVIDYSFEPGEQGNLEISIERAPEGLKVIIRDAGMPFDPKEISPEDASPEGACFPGSGVFGVKGCMDEISVHNRGRQGKETVLIKRLKNKKIEDYYEACDLEPYASPLVEKPLSPTPVTFIVRAMQPSEAIEVSKCIYRAYGYSYAYENLYYPERIVELNRSGQLHTAVAVTQDGEIAGQSALLFWHEDDRIAELAQAVVKPEFRGQGVLKEMTKYLLAKARSDGLIGVFVEAVTAHTYSQKVALSLGFKGCGIILGYFPRTMQFKHIAPEQSHRTSVLVAFLSLGRDAALQTYLPPRHQEVIEKLSIHLGLTREIMPAADWAGPRPQDYAVVRTTVIDSMSFARIEIEQYGANIIEDTRVRLKDLCLRGVDVISLYLKLSDPLTSYLTDEFEKMGFFFAGILPGALAGNDALILQYLNNVPIDYEKIQLDSDAGKRLLDYVMSVDPNRV